MGFWRRSSSSCDDTSPDKDDCDDDDAMVNPDIKKSVMALTMTVTEIDANYVLVSLSNIKIILLVLFGYEELVYSRENVRIPVIT